MTWLLLTELSIKTMTQLPDIDLLDVTPQDGLEVGDKDDMVPVNRAVHEDDDPIA